MIIRKYKETDLKALLDCWDISTRMPHPFMSDDFIAKERKNIEEIYIPNTKTWIVELSGELKGFITLMGNEVAALFLHPDIQGKGIGKALMDKAKSLHEDLEVDVFKVNAKGRDFYARCGFEHLNNAFHEPTGQDVLRLKFTKNK